MALVLADRVKETTTTSGTGTYTLAGAIVGFQSFGDAVGNSNTTYYTCTDGSSFEIGIGTYTASGSTLARTTILKSTNSNSAVDWGSTTKDIFVTYPADKATFKDASDNINGTFVGNITGNVTGNTSGTAATVTTAAQSNITSLGTLTTLTVDNIIINGTTIGHATDDTDLITLADGIVTVAGEISVTTLDIGGTDVTSTAAELNLLAGVSGLVQADLTKLAAVDSTAGELNLLDGSAKSTASITIDDADAFIVIDSTTTKQIPASDLKTYISAGDITGVTAGVGLSGGGSSGGVTLTLDLSELSDVTPANGDKLATLDSDGSAEQLTTVASLATLFAGTGLTASSSVIGVDAAQTGITSLLATDIKIGEDDQTKIDFETADTINFYAGNEKQLILTDGALTPGADNILDLGSSGVEFKDGYFDGTVTADAFAGPLTGNVTGNASGSSGSTTGNAATATALASARTIGGVSFDGTGNINLPGVNTAGNQNTSGNAATATALASARTIGGTSFDGTGNIAVALASVGTAVTVADESLDTTCFPLFTTAATGDLPPKSGSNLTFNSSSGLLTATLLAGDLTGDVTGNADTATALATARTIGGTSFDGTGNISVALATLATTVTITDNEDTDEDNAIIFTAGGDVDGGNLGLESDGTLTYNPSTGTVTATIFKGNIDAVDGDFDGTLEADAITVGGTALNTVIAGVTVTDATNSAHVLVTDNESTNEENLITFVEGATSSTGNVGLEMDGHLTYNPSTGTVTATIFKGNIDAVDGDFDGTLEADAITIGGTGIGSIYSAIAGSSSIVTTGALNSGSITSGFGTIDTGSSDITTTGLISGGSLDIDDVVINGTTIGHTDDTDLITVADGLLSVAGDLTIISTAGGEGDNPSLVLYRNSGSPADSDDLAEILFRGRNDNSEDVEYAKIWAEAIDVSDGTEDGRLIFQLMNNGSLQTRLDFRGNQRTRFFNQDVELSTGVDLIFEGATADAHETTVTVVDPTADRTITFPDATGTVITTGNLSSITSFTLGGTTPTLTIGDAGAEDTKLVFDGNAQDYHIGLDDSADDLVIGKGSTLGTTTAMAFDENGNVSMALQPSVNAKPGAQVIVTSLTTLTNFTENYDIGSNFASGVFTAPSAGKYFASFHSATDINQTAATQDAVNTGFFSLNDADEAHHSLYFSSQKDATIRHQVWGFSGICHLDAGDTLRFKVSSGFVESGQSSPLLIHKLS